MDSLLIAAEHVVLHHEVQVLGSVVDTSDQHLADIVFTTHSQNGHDSLKDTYVGLLKAIAILYTAQQRNMYQSENTIMTIARILVVAIRSNRRFKFDFALQFCRFLNKQHRKARSRELQVPPHCTTSTRALGSSEPNPACSPIRGKSRYCAGARSLCVAARTSAAFYDYCDPRTPLGQTLLPIV